MLWSLKHSPKNLSEFVGNDETKEELVKWARAFERGDSDKPVILHGKSGVGKTCLAYALAAEFGWVVIEANASNLRTPDAVNKLFGLTSNSLGLSGETRLLLFDEVDSTSERGEFQAIAEVIKAARQPVIFTADDLWDSKMSGLRLACKAFELKKVNASSVFEVLSRIAKAEGFVVKEIEGTLKEIAKASGGDVRGAIVDFQASCSRDGKCEVFLGTREREKNVFDAVRGVLKSKNFEEAMNAGENVDELPETFLLWLEENVPAEYESREEVARAFEALSRADVYLGRVRKTRDWGFLRYARALMLAGVGSAKEKAYFKFTRYGFPSGLRVLSSSKGSRGALKSAALKAGHKEHVSSAEAKKSVLPYLFLNEGVSKYFGFDEDDEKVLQTVFGVEKFAAVKKAKRAKPPAVKVKKK